MKRTIAEKFTWLLILVLIVMAIRSDTPVMSVITIILCTIPINPIILNALQRKIDGNRFDFISLLKWLFLFCGIVFALYIAFAIYGWDGQKTNVQYVEVEKLKAIIAIVMYFTYVLILFLYKNDDKSRKYTIFGIFYILCITFTFLSESMLNNVVSFLNKIFVDHVDVEILRMLYSTVLNPIKEAILTYIIFDVIFDEKREKESKNKKKGIDSGERARTKQVSVEVLNEQTRKTEKYKINIKKRY